MVRAISVIPAGQWTPPPCDRVVLDFDGRRRRRIALTGVEGTAFMLDLPGVTAMSHGDGLALEDGRVIAIEAAAEDLLEITCPDATSLNRIAWHLGNRHLPVEIGADVLRIRRDHVIRDMLEGLGATVRDVVAPFEPEAGAYASHHGHVHD